MNWQSPILKRGLKHHLRAMISQHRPGRKPGFHDFLWDSICTPRCLMKTMRPKSVGRSKPVGFRHASKAPARPRRTANRDPELHFEVPIQTRGGSQERVTRALPAPTKRALSPRFTQHLPTRAKAELYDQPASQPSPRRDHAQGCAGRLLNTALKQFPSNPAPASFGEASFWPSSCTIFWAG